MRPEFSVILPTRGLCPYLAETLSSVLSGPPEMEVLLIHDRREGEPELPSGLAADGRVRVLPSNGSGVSFARNRGLDEARGRFIAFVDDDDIWLPAHLERSRSLLERHPEAPMTGANGHILTGRPTLLPKDLHRLPRLLPERAAGPVPLHDLLLVNWFITSAVVLRREALAEHDRFDTGLAHMEDYDLWLRLARRSEPLYEPRHQVVVRRHDRNASGDRRRMAEGALHVLSRFLDDTALDKILTRDERRTREGRLWHDMAYACLVEDDVKGARRAVAESLRRLPGLAKNYVYFAACGLPGALRRALVVRGRRSPRVS